MKSVPPLSWARRGRHRLGRPPRIRSECLPYSTLSSNGCDKTHSMSFPNKPKNANLYGDQTAQWQHGDAVRRLTYRHLGNHAKLQQRLGNKTNFERSHETKCQRIVKSDCQLFSGKQKSEIQKQRLLPTWEFSIFPLSNSYHFPPTCVFQRPRIADKLELPGFSFLLLGPSQTLAKSSMA